MFPPLLVSARIELIFFLAVGSVMFWVPQFNRQLERRVSETAAAWLAETEQRMSIQINDWTRN